MLFIVTSSMRLSLNSTILNGSKFVWNFKNFYVKRGKTHQLNESTSSAHRSGMQFFLYQRHNQSQIHLCPHLQTKQR